MHLVRLTASLLAVAAASLSCSSSGDSAGESITQPTTTTEATSTTTSSVPTTTAAAEPESTDEIDPTGAVQAWIAMWDGVEAIVSDPESARAAITDVAAESVFTQLDTIYNPDVDSDTGNSPREFVNNAVATQQADGSVVIEDCLFETPKAGNATIWYSGTVQPVADGHWQVASITLKSELGCVPASLAAEAIAGYESYWDARVEFWDPADPTHPLVRQTLTGAQLGLVETLLADHAGRGLALRGRAEDHPEVIEVRSPTEIAILDCMTQDPARGLYVVETGERLGDIPPIAEGQLDLTSAVMILEDGAWKVSDVQGQADVSCDMAPTPQGLPVV